MVTALDDTSGSSSSTTWFTYATSASTTFPWSWLQALDELAPLAWYFPERIEATPESLYIHGRIGGKLRQSKFVSKIKPTGKGVTQRKFFKNSPRGFEHERFR